MLANIVFTSTVHLIYVAKGSASHLGNFYILNVSAIEKYTSF